MNPAGQPTLRLPLTSRATLLSLDMAATLAEIHLDHALERVESGEWRWAFDLAAGHERRTIHVWRECVQPQAEVSGGWELPAVIDAVVGTTMPEVRLVSLETRWSVRAQTIRRWLAAKEILWRRGDHTLWLSRAGLVAFLERRLVA